MISDDAGAQRRVKAEIGADVENDRLVRQKRPENANDIGFVLPTEHIAERLESRRVDTEIFARREPHQRPIGPGSNRTADPHSSRLGGSATTTRARPVLTSRARR